MSKIIDTIQQPSDLKELSYPNLAQLAEEIREMLVDVTYTNGGHLASNLGVVELSIALHRVFESPKDKILWDVSHQCYIHKLLTGRKDRFDTLRQCGGISGFTVREESPHDPFGTGHAGTSISAALGIANARDMLGDDYNVIAVIGDGSLTNGMALEGLNQAGQMGTRLIVVLNDNGMAISPSVGALSRGLNRLRFSHHYYKAKELAEVITRLPLGTMVKQTGRKAKDSFKSLFVPTMMLDELGFTYMGPVDGHNIAELEAAFHQALIHPGGPMFIHVITQKGKGYLPAEEDAVSFHGVAPNAKNSPSPSYSAVFGRTLVRIMRDNPKVVAITAAMEDGTGLKPVVEEFPERVYDVGICEEHAVTFAAGLASQGLVPVVAIYSTFLQRAYDQIIHDICIQQLPVVFAIDRGGIVGDDGKTHQGCFDISYLTCIPNMVVSAPRDGKELQHLLFTAIRSNRPMSVRYPRGVSLGGEVDVEMKDIPIGRGDLLKTGGDILLLGLGNTLIPSLAAATELENNGINCAVIDARYAKPLDSDLILQTAKKVKRVVTIEEGAVLGGFGSSVMNMLQSKGIDDIKIRCLGIPDEFVEHATQPFIRNRYHLDAPGIVQVVLDLFPELINAPKGRQRIVKVV